MKMYCPKCQKLFDDLEKCPDCLFSRLRKPEEGDPVLLAKLNFMQANMLKPMLEDMGIPCLVKGGLADAFAMGVGLRLDEKRVYVPFSAFDESSDVLEGFMNYTEANETETNEATENETEEGE